MQIVLLYFGNIASASRAMKTVSPFPDKSYIEERPLAAGGLLATWQRGFSVSVLTFVPIATAE